MGKYFNKKRLWTSHSLTISAATDKSAYKIAFNYKNEDSRYKNAGHDHFYLTADLSHKVLPFLKVGLSSRAYYIVKNDKPDMFNQFLHMSPLTQTRNEDGSYNVYPFGDPFVKNPYMNESDDVYKDKTEEWKLFLRFFAQIDLAKGLTFNTNFAYSPRLLVARLLLRQPLGIVYRRAQRGLHAQQPQGRLGLEQRAQLQTSIRQAQHRPDGRL